VRKSKIKQISLAVCLALMPFSSYAAGLGKLNVNSGIGEPLKAEIELLSVTPEELSTLAASIASEDAYAQQGIPRLGIHNNIKVDIAKNTDGSPILKIHSNQPVSDPYLDMLIQVDWATGRLQREYTILLDPPGYKPESNVSIPVTLPSADGSNSDQVANGASTKNVGEVIEPVTKKLKKQRRSAPTAVKQEQQPVSEPAGPSSQELTTKRGDTLSAVAKEVQVEGVSLDQMLVGLYENNKDAFSKGNMNRLKVGQIIKVPTKEQLSGIDQQQAKKTIKIHSADWNAYRNALAGNVEVAPAIAETVEKQSSSGKIATAEDKGAPAATGPKDVVKLSTGDKSEIKNAKDTTKSGEAKIIALQEETTARENSLKEANEKAVALEKQIADMQKLIEMKSQSMSNLQKNAETPKETPNAAITTPEGSNPVESKQSEATIPPSNESSVAKPEVKKAEITHPATLPPPVVEEPSFLTGLINSVDLTILGGLGGVALLGAGWMYLRNKRRKDLDSFERGILTSGGLRANTVFGNTTGNASMSDTSFLTDFAQSADGSMIDTNDVDPIAEAEVYMAYGRDAQAEEILKDAISKEPKRYELHLKLLEMYAARKDTSAFEAIAGELYTTLGDGDPTWAKVAAIGFGMEPSNPLYNLSKNVSSDPSGTQKQATANFNDLAVENSSEVSEDNVNSVEPHIVDNVDADLSFDLDTFDDVSKDSAENVLNSLDEINNQTDTTDSSSNLMDFDLGDSAIKPEINELASEIPVSDKSADAFEFNVPDISASTDHFEVPPTDLHIDFNLPADGEINNLVQTSSLEPNEKKDISFDLDFPTDEKNKVLEADVSEISFDFPAIDNSVDANINEVKSDEMNANTFDLSDIDLNLAGAESELIVEKPKSKKTSNEASVVADVSESQDVNIKLDLVSAYIDMDDKEGARELLEEILKEGGPNQQLRAKELLDGLV
jgi:pilus assembly protein FimV